VRLAAVKSIENVACVGDEQALLVCCSVYVSVLQCVAVCCSVMLCVAVYWT